MTRETLVDKLKQVRVVTAEGDHGLTTAEVNAVADCLQEHVDQFQAMSMALGKAGPEHESLTLSGMAFIRAARELFKAAREAVNDCPVCYGERSETCSHCSKLHDVLVKNGIA